MLGSALLLTVRDTLQDDAGDRYKDASFLRVLNMGLLELRRARPDYFIGRYATATPQLTSLDEEVEVPEIALPALVAYGIGMLEARDDEYTADGRAATFLAKFRSDLG